MKTSFAAASTPARWGAAGRFLLQHGRRHGRVFAVGSLMAVLFIALRLALPWIFASFLKPWLAAGQTGALEHWNSILGLAALLALGLSLLGLVDHWERLCFARFSIRTVSDMRAAALAAQTRRVAESPTSGDEMARLIGDSARIKNGLQGFLVHVATNGLLCAGVMLVMAWANVPVALVFLVAGGVMAALVAGGATRVHEVSLKQRRAEGRLADTLQESGAAAAFNRTSGRKEASVNRIQGRTTWAVHTVFGVALFLSVWIGGYEMRAGRLTGVEVVVMAVYAWMIRAPVVQLARQGARMGKIMASLERLAELFAAAPANAAPLAPLQRSIRLENIRIKSDAATGERRRLSVEALEIRAGERVAVLGKAGAGKTTLLTLLTGGLTPSGGRWSWDETVMDPAHGAALAEQVTLAAQDPRWVRQPLKLFLNPGAASEEQMAQVLSITHVGRVLARWPEGWAANLGSHDLSAHERQAVALARALFSPASVCLLDDPTGGLNEADAAKMITRILALEPRRTLLVALTQPVALELFDRVLRLKRGRVVFDGTPSQWREYAEARRVLRAAGGDEAPAKQAVILAAGCGRRYGGGLPKTLLPIGGRTLLEHQIEMLRRFGVEKICVVVGPGAEQVRGVGGADCTYVENPRPESTNSLYSLGLARGWVQGAFVLLNSDVLAHAEIYRRVLASSGTALAYDSASGTDDEHMKVKVNGERLEKIRKELPPGEAHGENVGLLKFSGTAVPLLFAEVERLLAEGGEGLAAPSAVEELAGKMPVRCLDIAGLPWAEIDFPEDLRLAQEQVWPLIA